MPPPLYGKGDWLPDSFKLPEGVSPANPEGDYTEIGYEIVTDDDSSQIKATTVATLGAFQTVPIG